MHEDLNRTEETKGSSDRGFGLTFAAVGAILALWPVLAGGWPRWWLLVSAIALLAVSMVAPAALGPLNRQWQRFGLLLHRIVSPCILALVFFGVVMPLGVALRALGRNPLPLRFDPATRSYWIERHPPGPPPRSMLRQF